MTEILIRKLKEELPTDFEIRIFRHYSPTYDLEIVRIDVYRKISGKSYFCMRYDNLRGWHNIRKEQIYEDMAKRFQRIVVK